MKEDSTIPTTDGPAWAAMLAAAVGGFAFGLVTVVSEAAPGVSKLLVWYRPAGALSGVAGCAILVWIAAWVVLNHRWKNRNVMLPRAVLCAVVALVIGAVVMTFPPFYELF
jgi:hypothetical protein